MSEPRKLSFEEAWESSVVFFVDPDVEDGIDAEVENRICASRDAQSAGPHAMLDVMLKDAGLSDEKFMRVVSLLRKIGRVPGAFDREWSMPGIRARFGQDPQFRDQIVQLLHDGARDTELARHVPRYCLETLDLRHRQPEPAQARRRRYKSMLIGTYSAAKGHAVEGRIRGKLAEVQAKYGLSHGSGRARIVDTTIDFAVPSIEDPWVVIMSSFQETTSSGQSVKARDMLNAYERVMRSNSVYGENRAFVNFVDGGGWLARKRDFQRLVEQCHYFVNLQHVDMIEGIVLKHVPRRCFASIPS